MFIANLGNFDAPEITRVKLSGETVFGRAPVYDHKRSERFRQRGLLSLGPSPTKLNSWVVRTRIRSRGYDAAEDEARQTFHRVSLALHLLKPGEVSVGGALAYQPGVQGSERDPAIYFAGAPMFSARITPYVFSHVDKTLLQRLYDGLPTMPEEARLALRRFEGAYQREAVQDRLVDHWVALESLFAKRSEGELRYKFAMRIAYFLEREPESRLNLFGLLYDAYQVRSDILHGSVSKKDMTKAEEVSADALRRSLQSVVMEHQPPDSDGLDELAAQGIPRRRAS